jgi:outer membrane protein assembly factor BamB
LYVWFGSAGLFCYDFDGKLIWSRDLGNARTRLSFGEASSPVIDDDKLIVTRDQEDPSYILVVDARTGETIWRADRDEPSGWSTPLVVEFRGTRQLVTNGKNRVRSYNLRNGELLWQCGGQASNITPSPVATSDTVYCMSGYRGSALYALPLNASGDITDSDTIKWTKNRATPYIPSPLLYDGLLYYTQSLSAILSCADAETGEVLIDRKRLSGIRNLYASPVAAAGRIYIAGRDGTTLVIRAGGEYQEIAENALNEGTDASPAIVGKQLFLRGKSHLYCIATPE